jgi:hypothetical protein
LFVVHVYIFDEIYNRPSAPPRRFIYGTYLWRRVLAAGCLPPAGVLNSSTAGPPPSL